MYSINFSYRPSWSSSRIYGTEPGKFRTREERDQALEERRLYLHKNNSMNMRVFTDDVDRSHPIRFYGSMDPSPAELAE